MNKEYIEKIFDQIPSEQRNKILRSKIIKEQIPGFRRLDSAPPSILKRTLRTNETFAAQFFDAVIDMYGCSSEQYTDEEQLSKLTHDNFWGIFARKCKNLDSSPESCEILEEMLQEYEKLTASNLPNTMEDTPVPSADYEYLGQGDSEIVDKQTYELPSIGAIEMEEDNMPEFIQYIGYIQEMNGFCNFWPVYVIYDGTIERFEEGQKQFPELGNINLFSTPWDYVRSKCSNNEILVITISPSDLIDNVRSGNLQRTNYKVDFKQLERQGRIKRLKDIQMYPVLHPVGSVDFTKRTILVKEEYVDTKDLCLIEEANTLYGPYQVSADDDGQPVVNINLKNNSIVDSYRPKNGEISYIEIDIQQGYPSIVIRSICLDEAFGYQAIDKITDQDLLKLFQRYLSERINGENLQIALTMADDYAGSAFHGLPAEIIENRVQRIKTLLEDQLMQKEVQDEVVKFVADLLGKYGDSNHFSSLLERILDDSNLAQKIQSFAIASQKLSDMQQQYEDIKQEYEKIKNKCAKERKDLETEAKNMEARVSALAESTNDEIRELNAERDKLRWEIEDLKQKKDGWEEIINLDRKKTELEIINDNLRDTERKLREKGDEAVIALQAKLKQATANAVDTAFEGRIADQIFQAAAGWNQHNQNELLQEIAGQLVGSTATDILSNEDLVEYLIESVQKYRPDYTRNEILNIFISISQNFLTVFSGEPGTGKTSICNIVAHVLGTSQIPSLVQNGANVELSRYVPISVERGWTSKRDFIGYYNSLSQAFEQTNKHLYDGLRLLDAEGEQSKYPYIVLLDEANLSPIEYYWADFMNICDGNSRFGKITLGNDIQLKIPPTLRFVATINNDDTTERLSPRLIDRAVLIRLPDVPYTTVEDEDLKDTSFVKVVEWTAIQAVFNPNSSRELDEMDAMPNEIYKDICNLFRESMKLSVSPRVDRAIKRYWATAKDLFESESGNDTTIIALDYAVAQKLLPKINGSGKAYRDFLDKFKELCEKNNLEKSRTILANIIKRGEASMSYYQYF